MKKKLSLILAVAMIATMILSVIPFGAFAEDAVEYEARIGDAYYVSFLDAFIDIYTPGVFESDVTITLLKDIDTGTSEIRLKSPKNADETVNYTLTVDGDGHRITTSRANAFMMGADGAVATAEGYLNESVVVKDLDIQFMHTTGAAIHIRGQQGTYVFDDVNIVAPNPVQWGLVNSNISTVEGAKATTIFNDVDMIQPAYAKTESNGGDGAFVRNGNGGGTSPYTDFLFYDCNLVCADAVWSESAPHAAKGVYVNHNNSYFEFNNCYIKSKNSPVYITGSIDTVEEGGEKPLAKLIDTKIEMFDAIDSETEMATFASGLPSGTEISKGLYNGDRVVIEGAYVDPAGIEAQVVAETAGRVPYTTLADAIAAAKVATEDATIVLTKDITLTEAITIEAANAEVTVTLDGDDHRITSAVDNAIKLGAAGAAANIDLVDLDIEYTGAAAAVQVNAIGNVTIYDVDIETAAAALDVAAAAAVVAVEDVKFEGATASLIKTADGLAAAVAVKGSVLSVNAGVELYTVAGAVECDDNCLLSGELPAGAVVTTTEPPATTTTEAPNTTTAETPAGTTAGEEPTGTTAGDAPTGTTAGDDTPAGTTAAPETPEATTTAAPEAEGDCAGCGGIAIAAQLVALVCAAAVIVIKKK